MNERTGDEVDLADIVKGYDTGGEYVIVEPQELDEIVPGRSRSIDVAGFVDLDTVDPVFFDKTYFLGPGEPSTGRSTPSWSAPWPSRTRSASPPS